MALEYDLPPSPAPPVPVRVRERKSQVILHTEEGSPYAVQAHYERIYLDANGNRTGQKDQAEDELFNLTPEFVAQYPDAARIAGEVSAFIDQVRADRRAAAAKG